MHKVTRQKHAPRLIDWKLVKRIAWYLKASAGLKITIKSEQDDHEALRLDAFTDTDFAANKADRKSMTGGVLRLNGIAVSWGARKQGGMSLSTMEAEFVAASEMACKMLGLCEMLSEVCIAPVIPSTTKQQSSRLGVSRRC